MFTSDKESEFFKGIEYNFIGHEFNYNALEELTSIEFVKEIQDRLDLCYMKRFSYTENENCFFFEFYADDRSRDNKKITIINAYHNKKDYFSIDVIRQDTLKSLGLSIVED